MDCFNTSKFSVISNGVNTRYYANNRKQEFKQTFYWADQENNLITQLEDFADSFLEKCHVSKMICKYIVLHESDKVLMVLRPYQYYAVEAIIERVKDTDKNGYIWHTTGSGKTLTSFKAAQILTQLPKCIKCCLSSIALTSTIKPAENLIISARLRRHHRQHTPTGRTNGWG
jgi:type I restriction enzyme R subunit